MRPDPGAAFQPVRLPGADVSYRPVLDLGLAPELLLAALVAETPWRQESVTLWGKTVPQPRLVAWYGAPGCSYRYSGLTLQPLRWTAWLLDIRRRVETAAGHAFNCVLLNRYRDQADSMGMHSDDEPELGPRPVIASLSLGAERVILFKRRRDPGQTARLKLASGSLLMMRGDTQANYKHGIAKQMRPIGERVNLTFRTIHGPVPA